MKVPARNGGAGDANVRLRLQLAMPAPSCTILSGAQLVSFIELNITSKPAKAMIRV